MGSAHEPTEKEKSNESTLHDDGEGPPSDLCCPQLNKHYSSDDNIVRCPCGVNEVSRVHAMHTHH